MHDFATPDGYLSALEAELATHFDQTDEVELSGLLVAVVDHTIFIRLVRVPAARGADWRWTR